MVTSGADGITYAGSTREKKQDGRECALRLLESLDPQPTNSTLKTFIKPHTPKGGVRVHKHGPPPQRKKTHGFSIRPKGKERNT